jgi:hypothetical protein
MRDEKDEPLIILKERDKKDNNLVIWRNNLPFSKPNCHYSD